MLLYGADQLLIPGFQRSKLLIQKLVAFLLPGKMIFHQMIKIYNCSSETVVLNNTVFLDKYQQLKFILNCINLVHLGFYVVNVEYFYLFLGSALVFIFMAQLKQSQHCCYDLLYV